MSEGKLKYYIQGSGETIILLHGWGGSSRSLAALQSFLSKDFQAITVDLPGFGDSPEPESVYGITDYAGEIIKLAGILKIKKFYLFGHSFGGQIATKLVLDHPEVVEKLILCDASPVRQRRLGVKVKIKIAQFIKRIGLSPALKILLRNSDYQKASPKMKQIMTKILQEDLTENLSKIKTTTLILWGKQDKDTPLWMAKMIHQKIKGSKLKVFDGFRHGLPLFGPELVAREIKEFLGE